MKDSIVQNWPHSIKAIFKNTVTDDRTKEWKEYFLRATSLLPEHLIKVLDGLEIVFVNSPDYEIYQEGCNDKLLGCVHRDQFRLYLRLDRTYHYIKKYTEIWELYFIVVGIFLHELAHCIEHRLSPDKLLFDEFRGIGTYPTKYAERGLENAPEESAKEDFADSFETYILHPNYLKKICPLRYQYLKENIFGGIEYTDNFPLTLWNKLEFTHLEFFEK